MSTTQGTNPITGTVITAAAEAAEQAAQEAKAKEAELSKAVKAADREFIGALKAGEKAVQKIADALATASELELHKHTTNEVTGKPFTSFTAYVQARTAEFPLMHKVIRKELVKVLTEAGHSVRQIAAATNASVGTVAGDQKEAGLTTPKPQLTDAEAAAAKVAAAVKAYANAATRVMDLLAEMTAEELATVMATSTDVRTSTAATRKLRQQAADKAADKAMVSKPQPTTKPQPSAPQASKEAVAVGA